MPVQALPSEDTVVRSDDRIEQKEEWDTAHGPPHSINDSHSHEEQPSEDGDESGLHERSDWPLSDATPLPAAAAPQDEGWRPGDEHGVTADQTSWLDDQDVSDLEEDDMHDSPQPTPEKELESRHTSGSEVNGTITYVLAPSDRHAIDIPSPITSPVSAQSPKGIAHLRDEVPASVSPVGTASRNSLDVDNKSTSSLVSNLEQEQVTQEEHESATPRVLSQSVFATAGAPSLEEASAFAAADVLSLDHPGYAEEHLDSTPPLPSDSFRPSLDNPRLSMQSLPGYRRPSDSSTHVRHAHHSSIAKPYQHSRQSSYNTTQIDSNRDRVRYSWQSVHEDESNKPRIHVIKLVSNTASASSAFPQGEAFGFSISPGGRRIAAYNSARLYILQTAALPVGITQDFSLKRRPLAVELNDNGNLIAILADEHTVNVYDLSNSKLKRAKTIKMDFSTSCIALASCGGLLAAAYDGGIEVFSLAANALPTDRRAVRAPKMDRLTFSDDGSTLLGTTTRIHASHTVMVNVPIFPAAANGVPTPEELKLAWCSELLHPENIRNSSHAAYMREDRTIRNEHLFAWNGLADTFGILHTADMEYGPVDFPLVVSPPLSTCGGLGAAVHSCPTVDEFGDTVAMIVNDRTIRLYIVPQTNDDADFSMEAHSIDHELDDGYGCPFHEVRWVHSPAALPTPIRSPGQTRGRLLVTSPGGVFGQEQAENSFEEIEGGRIILFDFDPQFAGQPGQTFVLNLGKSPPQPLEEEEYNVADAVALVRRRTVKQNNADMKPIALGRAATTLNSSTRNHSRPNSSALYSRRTASILSVGSSVTESSRDLPDLVEDVESSETLEEPFSNQAPRSQASLQRAASNAQRHRFQSIEERDQETTAAADGTRTFLPLPEYTEEPNAPLPSRFRAMAGLDTPANRSSAFVPNSQPYAALNSHGVPMSAPPAVAETFSADQAFAAANAAHMHNQRNVAHNNAAMPRGLMRAYSNAANSLYHTTHQSRSRVGDDASSGISSVDQLAYTSAAPSTSGGSANDEDGIPPSAMPSNSMIARAYDNRFSTPMASLADYQSDLPRRSSSTRRPGEHIYGSRNYNTQALRQATATASLFPPTQSSDHLPLPSNFRLQSAGNVAHPITNWRPPAPSVVIPPQSSGQHSRGHSRRSSITSRSAFATTAKAKRLGFFKKKTSARSGSVMSRRGEDGRLDDSRSMMTWNTSSEKKCVVM